MPKNTPTETALTNKAREAKATAVQGDQPGAPAPQDIKKRLVEGIGQGIRLNSLLSRAATSLGIPQAAEKINSSVQLLTEAQKLVDQGQMPTVPAQAAQGAGMPATGAGGAQGMGMMQGGM